MNNRIRDNGGNNITKDYELLVQIGYELSMRFDGVQTKDLRKQRSTILLAKCINIHLAVLRLLPYTSLNEKNEDHPDFSAIGALLRSTIEASLYHWYLSVQAASPEEIEFRFVVEDYHDALEDEFIVTTLQEDPDDLDYITERISKYRNRLLQHPHYLNLERNKQKQIFKGKMGSVLSLREIVGLRDINQEKYDGWYKMLSSHLHVSSSSQKMLAFESTSIENRMTELLTLLALHYSSGYLADMIKNVGILWGIAFRRKRSARLVNKYADNLFM